MHTIIAGSPIARLRGVALTVLVCVALPPGVHAQSAAQAIAVTVIKASKSCFAANVEVFGVMAAAQEIAVRPDREGMKISQVLVDPGNTVTAGQPLARLTPAEGGEATIAAPVAGIIAGSSATVGTVASASRPPLFRIIARGEFELVAEATARDLSKIAIDQTATIRVIGAGVVQGRVKRVADTLDSTTQLGQVRIAVTSIQPLLINSSGRATIKTGESCGVAVPLSAVLYGNSGPVIQVVRQERVETRRVEVGLLSGGQAEIRTGLAEGDIVVAKAGALLREGDLVRPIGEQTATAK
jgi:multidrug efflux pump subunit AcrA (membrane-fusion protein)